MHRLPQNAFCFSYFCCCCSFIYAPPPVREPKDVSGLWKSINQHGHLALLASSRSQSRPAKRTMSDRTWSCLCGSFSGKVTGDPKLAVWCHCQQCRKFTGAAMQLGVWDDGKIAIVKGDDNVNKYESKPGIFRNTCKTCGAFVYKTAGPGFNVVPLGALEGGEGAIKPTCHIFVADKGDQDVMFPDLPQHDEFPAS